MTEDMKKEENGAELPDTDTILAEAEEMVKGKEQKKKAARKAEAELLEAQARIAEQEKALEEQNDKYLRLAAEYDNFRRRTAQERGRIYDDAYAEALAALFPVVDNLERAAQYSDGESVAKGVAMILRSVEDTLAKLGVTEIEAQGKTFDPNLHNAVMHVEDESFGESEIVEVLQKGYQKGERVLRYAMVKVAN